MRLKLGDRLMWEDTEFELIAFDAREARLRSVDGGFTRVALISELIHDPSVDWDREASKPIAVRNDAVLHGLGEPSQAAALMWEDAVRRYFDLLNVVGRTREDTRRGIEEILAGVRAQLPHAAVSDRTLRRRAAAYKERGLPGAIDGRATAVKTSRWDPCLLEIVEEQIGIAVRESTATIIRLMTDIRWAVEDRYGDSPPFPMPSESTLRRIIDTFPLAAHLKSTAKLRATTANVPDRLFSSHGAVRLGEHVQIDTTRLDAEVLLPNGKITARGGVSRPELTILYAVDARLPLAALVRPYGTKSVDLVALLARALTPYGLRPASNRRTRELVSAAWADPFGISQEELNAYRTAVPYVFPEVITTDNGKIYTSKDFRSACELLGISLILAPPYTPTGKPHVEQKFDSFNEQFAQYLRSHVGRSVEHRGRDTAEHLAPTLTQVQELLEDWIAVVWVNRPHPGLRDPIRPSRMWTPLEMANMLREQAPELPVPFGPEEYVSLLPAENRIPQSYGINRGRRVYSSKEARAVMRSTSRKKKWTIRFDPHDFHTIWLDLGDRFIPMQWTHGSAARTPFESDRLLAQRIADSQPRTEDGRERAKKALLQGLRKGRYGDPRPDRQAAQAEAARDDDMVLSHQITAADDVDIPASVDDTATGQERFRRTGGHGFLESPDVDDSAWREAGGFAVGNAELRERLE